MTTYTSKYDRLSRLQDIGEDDSIDATIRVPRRTPDHRVVASDGQPVVPLLAVLQAEVARCEERLEAARHDLRRYLLSHDHAE